MALRTVALYDGKEIGIETIYTVVNGRQINIPEKIEILREKGRKNELFCPCGCGSNLILVAGDKNLRAQHFRIKKNDKSKECRIYEEGKGSIDSKIVLKCWLDEKLHDEAIETRVPIHAVDDVNRKYEFTFFSRNKSLALNYWYNRADISDEKINILESHSKGIKILYVVDSSNGGSEGQYPEALMKLQNIQGYCLLLNIDEADYYKASMKAAYYYQDNTGLWRERIFVDGLLREYMIDSAGKVFYRRQTLEQLLIAEKNAITVQLQEDIAKKCEEEKIRLEKIRVAEEEEKRKQEELQRIWIERKEKADKQRAAEEEKKRIEAEKERQEYLRSEENFKSNMEANFLQQVSPVIDPEGNRWIKCEFCGKIAKEGEFRFFGGSGHVNLGTCQECADHNPLVQKKREEELAAHLKKKDPKVCPECGGNLVERHGPFGLFIGCSNYPKCKYKRNI